MDRLGVLCRDKDTAAMVRVEGGSSVLSSAQRLTEFLPLGTVIRGFRGTLSRATIPPTP